jgi:hypothetical protein
MAQAQHSTVQRSTAHTRDVMRRNDEQKKLKQAPHPLICDIRIGTIVSAAHASETRKTWPKTKRNTLIIQCRCVNCCIGHESYRNFNRYCNRNRNRNLSLALKVCTIRLVLTSYFN